MSSTIDLPQNTAWRPHWPSLREFCDHAFPHYLLWVIVIAVLAFDYTVIALSPQLSLVKTGYTVPMVCISIGFLLILIRCNFAHRFDWILHRGWAFTTLLVLQMAYGPALNIYNHVLMSSSLPLTDDMLNSWDKALGLDWLGYANTITSNPQWVSLLDFAYGPVTAYGVSSIIIAALILDNRKWLLETLFLVCGTGIVCITFSTLFPSLDAMAVMGTAELKARLPENAGIYHMQQFLALRSDLPVVLDIRNLQGLSTFPSFHTCLALIIAWCSRRNIFTAIIGGVSCVSILIATPVFGGHYFVDLFAGGVVTLAVIMTWNRIADQLPVMFGQEYPLPFLRRRATPA